MDQESLPLQLHISAGYHLLQGASMEQFKESSDTEIE